jgi:hypothetical protein
VKRLVLAVTLGCLCFCGVNVIGQLPTPKSDGLCYDEDSSFDFCQGSRLAVGQGWTFTLQI